MKYLLDTNTCIQFLNKRSQALIDRLTETPDDDVLVCSIVKAEMFFGSLKSARRERNLVVQRAFFSRYASLPFDDAAAEKYAEIRADLEARGRPVGANDLMIAAIALAHDLTLVTHNTSEFSRVTKLGLEDWEAAR
jgi:tRNA(fMet)-specific endonuclease VapC